MQAKDTQIQELRAAINQRDNSMQKFIKLNGSLVQNPKEEPYSKVIVSSFEKAQILQEEKIGLVEKAAALVGISITTFHFSAYMCYSWIATSSGWMSSFAIYRTMVPYPQIHRCHRF